MIGGRVWFGIGGGFVLQTMDLAEEGGETADEAGVEAPEAGEGRGFVFEELTGDDGLGSQRVVVRGRQRRQMCRVMGGAREADLFGEHEVVFDGGDLLEFPGDVGNFADERAEKACRGAEFVLVGGEEIEEGGVGREDGGGEAVFDGVLGRGGLAFGRARARGVLGVGAVGRCFGIDLLDGCGHRAPMLVV